jgi:hypothetical protein
VWEIFGQAWVDAWICVLQKGVGKVPFNPQIHKPEDRRTAIKVEITPLPDLDYQGPPLLREYVAEFGEWPKITLPSFKALGLTTRQLNRAWVRVQLVGTGRTYTNQAGETKEATTFKFLAIYPDQATCQAAYLNQGAPATAVPDPGNGTAPMLVKPPESRQAPAMPPPQNGKERETALKFVQALVRQVNGDEDQLANRLAKMPLIAKHFTIQSPEVMNLLAEYQFAQLKPAGPTAPF